MNHYQEASLNRIKTVTDARFCINFEHKIRKRIFKFVLNVQCVT